MKRRKLIQRKTPKGVGFRDRNLFNQIMGAVCRTYDVHESTVWSRSVEPTACRARLMALYVMRTTMTARDAEIAAMMGVPRDEVADSHRLISEQIQSRLDTNLQRVQVTSQLPQHAQARWA